MNYDDAKLIRPISKYIFKLIQQKDKRLYPKPSGITRYYSYLTTMKKELIKVTVAVKNRYSNWHYKQCAVHGIHSKICLVKDMCYTNMSGYITGWYFEGLTRYPKWYEFKEWGYNDDKYFDTYSTIINLDFIEKFPEYKYSAYKLYSKTNILEYLRQYEQHPQIEYFMKLGLEKYVFSKMILKQATKDKLFCKWLVINKDELIHNHYDMPVILRAYKKNKPLQELQAIETAKKSLRNKEYEPITELFKKNLERFLLYIGKQGINISSYLDYLNACKYLQIDLTEEKNKLPHDFKRWHDIRIDEYHSLLAKEDEEKRQNLYTQFATVAEKYLPLQYNKKYGYVSIIAQKPSDLVLEGDTLHHCVGRMNYDQKMIREETLIFFIREKEKPNVPLVTVEYSVSSHKVLQCYADHDSKPNEEIQHFVNKVWLPHANKQIKKLQAA